jgi:hypothetical protein
MSERHDKAKRAWYVRPVVEGFQVVYGKKADHDEMYAVGDAIIRALGGSIAVVVTREGYYLEHEQSNLTPPETYEILRKAANPRWYGAATARPHPVTNRGHVVATLVKLTIIKGQLPDVRSDVKFDGIERWVRPTRAGRLNQEIIFLTNAINPADVQRVTRTARKGFGLTMPEGITAAAEPIDLLTCVTEGLR